MMCRIVWIFISLLTPMNSSIYNFLNVYLNKDAAHDEFRLQKQPFPLLIRMIP